MSVTFHRRLFENTSKALAADGSEDNLINLEGVHGEFSFMDMDTTLESLEDVRPVSSAPADEEHLPGSSDSDDDSDGKEGRSGGGTNDELTALDFNHDLVKNEEPLPLEIPAGFDLVSRVSTALTAAFVKRSIELRLGIGWLRGTVTRQVQAGTRHPYDYRVLVERDGSTRSVKLPLTKNLVDGSSGEGSWTLLEYFVSTAGFDKEGEGEEEEERKRKRRVWHAWGGE